MRWLILVVLAGCDGAASGGTVKIDDGAKAQIAALTATVDALTDRIEALEAASVDAAPIGGPPESGTVIVTFTGAECTGSAMFIPWPGGANGAIDPEDVPMVAVSVWSGANSAHGRYQSFAVVDDWTCGAADNECGYTIDCNDADPARVYRVFAL